MLQMPLLSVRIILGRRRGVGGSKGGGKGVERVKTGVRRVYTSQNNKYTQYQTVNTRVFKPPLHTSPHPSTTTYKSSTIGLSPCAVPSLSSNQNLNLSTFSRSAIQVANAGASVFGCSRILLAPSGAGKSSRVLHPSSVWYSSLRMKLCSSLAASGCGAAARMAPVCAQDTNLLDVGSA